MVICVYRLLQAIGRTQPVVESYTHITQSGDIPYSTKGSKAAFSQMNRSKEKASNPVDPTNKPILRHLRWFLSGLWILLAISYQVILFATCDRVFLPWSLKVLKPSHWRLINQGHGAHEGHIANLSLSQLQPAAA